MRLVEVERSSMSEIMFLKEAGRFVPMTEKPYEAEEALQALLAEHPEMLVGGSADGDRRFLLISREVGVPDSESAADRWALDHLLVDQDGVPTFLEAKRSVDPRSRREVVAQMLDYAANGIANWSGDQLRAQLVARLNNDYAEEHAALSELLETDEPDPATFWQQVSENLDLGRIRLLFVAERIPHELRTIIEFLNRQMAQAEVLGLELRQFANGATQVLSPNVIGKLPAAAPKSQSRPKKDPDPFLVELSQWLHERVGNRVRLTKTPTRFIQGRFGHPDIHYEILGYGADGLALGIHFESRDSHLNQRNVEAIRDRIETVADRNDLSTRIGIWGRKWARAEVLVPEVQRAGKKSSDYLGGLMQTIIETTYEDISVMPREQDSPDSA
jgi:hypothetical protein